MKDTGERGNTLAPRRRTDAALVDHQARLLRSPDFHVLLSTFSKSTGLTVQVFGADAEPRLPVVCSTPLANRLAAVGVWESSGAGRALSDSLVRRVAGEHSIVTVRAFDALRVVAIPLAIEGTLLGTLVAGWVFDSFPDPVIAKHLGSHVALPFHELWPLVRQQPPIGPEKLDTYARLLEMLAGSFLRERGMAIMASQRNADLQTLNDACTRMTTAVTEQEIAQVLVDAACHVGRTDRVHVLRMVEDGEGELLAACHPPTDIDRRRVARVVRVDLEDGSGGRLGVLEMELRPTQSEPWPEEAVATLAAVAGVTLARARAMAALESERERLGEANRAKDEFMAVLSHELRTPMAPIVGWADMLVRGTVPADRLGRAYEAIAKNAQRELQLIEEMLDLSRILNGKIVLDRSVVPAADAVAHAVDLGERLAQGRDLSFRLEMPERPLSLNVDPHRLDQMLANLVANAVKFTPDGGTITVGAREVPDRSDVDLFVADSGIGMSAATLGTIFHRFRQADATTTRRYGGLGIGLSIVRSLAEMHGGQAFAESAGEGQGSRFVVRLPRWSGQEVGHEPAEPSPAVVHLPAAARPRVLLVDDAADTLDVVRAILEHAGHTVFTARSAMDALDLAKKDPPDVILCDIAMPEIDGFGFLRAVRADALLSRVPVIALTSYAGMAERGRIREAGFDAYLAKPVDAPTLNATLGRFTAPAPHRHDPGRDTP